MPYEVFDPAGACDPNVPLNPITQTLIFYKINVFEKTITLVDHKPDGRIDPTLGFFHPFNPRQYRLGIPLTDIHPELIPQLRTQFVRGGAIDPIRLGIEQVYIPTEMAHKEPAAPKDAFVFQDDLAQGHVIVEGKKIPLESMLDDLERTGRALYKAGDLVVGISRAPRMLEIDYRTVANGSVSTSIGNVRFTPAQLKDLLSKGRTSIEFNGSPVQIKAMKTLGAAQSLQIKGPAGLDDQLYAEVLGDSFVRRPKARRKLPAYEIGLFTTFEQNWLLKGYSRGSLLSSLTLAPEEELSIEVFTFDRLKIEEERTSTAEFERNLDTSTLARVAAKVATELTETTDSNASLKVGIPLPIEGIPVDVSAGAGVTNQVKSGIQATVDNINEATVRSSEKFKSTTQVKIVQTRETGDERRTIRKIKNPNLGRTLTFNYFEILETYDVTTKLKDTKQFCLLVDNPDLGPVKLDFVLAFEDKLQRALLSANYKAGFDAAKKLAAQRWFESSSVSKVELDVANQQARGADPAKPAAPQNPIVTIGKNLKKKLKQFLDTDLLSAADVLAKHYNPLLADSEKPSPDDVSKAEDALGLSNFWFKFKLVTPGVESRARDYVNSVPDNAGEAVIVEQLQLFLAGMDDEWFTSLKMVAVNLVALSLAPILGIVSGGILLVWLGELALIDNPNGLPALIEKGKKDLATYETATAATSLLPAPPVDSPAVAPVAAPPPPQAFPLDELAIANAEFTKLALHIEANRLYYMNQIWLYEDSNTRFERLRLKGIAKFVENRLLGFVGNKSVFPLRLDTLGLQVRKNLERQIASFDPEADEELNGVKVGAIEERLETISLPTNGVYLESMLGKCDALEPYLNERRVIEKQLAQAQADLAAEKARQQVHETKRVESRLDAGQLDPF